MAEILTVFADASFKDGYAGYAIWGRGSGEKRVEKAFPVEWKVASSDEAEAIALFHGVKIVLDDLAVPGELIVVAQSDCLSALTKLRTIGGQPAKTSDCYIWYAKQAVTGEQHRYLMMAKQALKDHKAKLYLKHVKGHQGGFGARTLVNRWCDQKAAEARRLAEELLGPKESVDALLS